MNPPKIFDYPLFASGFRAFFALAGLSALFLILLWNVMIKGGAESGGYFPPTIWHGHEMLMGYSVAVITGLFFATLSAGSGKPILTGDVLGGLCLLWLYGRILPFYSGLLPDVLIAGVDFSFIPLLAWLIYKLAWHNYRSYCYVFLAWLALVAVGNGLIHTDALGWSDNTAWLGFKLIVGAVIVLILVVAGQCAPFLIERGLKGTLIMRHPWLDSCAVASVVLMFALEVFEVSGTVLAMTAVLSAIANSIRLVFWYVPRIWYVPLLWILWVGYFWIIVGFVLTALSAFNIVLPAGVLHAFTVGGMAVLSLGLMARVSLGYTGRALKVSNAMAIAFLLVNVAVLLQVVLPITLPHWYALFVYLSSLAWLLAFVLFVVVYWPVLTQVRVDGQAG